MGRISSLSSSIDVSIYYLASYSINDCLNFNSAYWIGFCIFSKYFNELEIGKRWFLFSFIHTSVRASERIVFALGYILPLCCTKNLSIGVKRFLCIFWSMLYLLFFYCFAYRIIYSSSVNIIFCKIFFCFLYSLLNIWFLF